ncbi:MAG: hypothetical protein DRI77_14660 [Chloroflexi bacterium]|nr:MAG: hypothetical protein DRI77_14660 [Chloroflexota bacterium]
MKRKRTERFERLRQLAEQNAAFNDLGEEEAMILIEETREEIYRLQQNTLRGTEVLPEQVKSEG